MQVVMEAHDTPVRELLCAPGGARCAIDQWPSFDTAARALGPFDPTTAQPDRFGHETALNVEPIALGVFWIAHAEPSQCSTSGPTAVHELRDAQETSTRSGGIFAM